MDFATNVDSYSTSSGLVSSNKQHQNSFSSPSSSKGAYSYCNVAMKEWPRIEQSGSYDYDAFRWSMQNLEKIMDCMEGDRNSSFSQKRR
mmetsp:Transcript_16537/g.27431  ORF Transcript_16537/g.27431 Transcript_16537/m.27431 type:complete len:89 (-) Transcript_16537:217-483(-)